MKIGDKVQRVDIMGDITNHTIHDAPALKYHKDLHKDGMEYSVLTNGEWVRVPRVIIHQRAVPEACESCSA